MTLEDINSENDFTKVKYQKFKNCCRANVMDAESGQIWHPTDKLANSMNAKSNAFTKALSK